MGMVDEQNRVNFYDGMLRVVAPDGHEWAKFHPNEYQTYIAEHTEPWTYMKFCHLKSLGWQGFTEGPESGVYCVAPLARLNAADGMATPLAEEAYLEFFGTLGGKPVHHTLANHWARVIELLYAAERMKELANDPELTDPDVRAIPTEIPHEGIGVVEAPRGTLFHHYRTDERGPDHEGQSDRGHAEQRGPHRHERGEGRARADHRVHGGRWRSEHGGDGFSRLRSLPGMRHSLAAGQHAAVAQRARPAGQSGDHVEAGL